MEDTQKPQRKHYEWLKPHQFKKGNRANPGGRPKGSISLKTFAKNYLLSLPDNEKIEFLKCLPEELIWRMAEGNPPQKLEGDVEKPLVQIVFDKAFKKES